MRITPGTRNTLGAGLVLLVLVGASWLFLERHSGLAAAMWSQARHAGFKESWNNYRFLSYMARYLVRLSFNPESGYYDFEGVRRAAETDLERGLLAYHVGDFTTAVKMLERSLDKERGSEELMFWLANSYMRLAEADNCLAALRTGPLPPDKTTEPPLRRPEHLQLMCSLPLNRYHSLPESSRRARELLHRLRAAHPGNRVYQWLLNFTYMTLGEFPQRVPPEDRIDTAFVDTFYGQKASQLAQEHSDLVFRDRASALHVDTFDAGKGVAVEDFDLDGDLDIITGGNFDPLHYYVNQDGRDFVERTQEAGLGAISQVHIITAADYDNDGWVDLFVGRPFLPYLLLHNNGDGTFDDVTLSAGLLDGWLDDEISFTWGSAWGDADNDGDLDLFISRWGLRIPFLDGLLARPYRGSLFFRNQGGGRFVDHTAGAGLTEVLRDRVYIGAAWGDSDNDGDLDLFVSSIVQNGSRLLANDGGGRFSTRERHGPGFMAAFLDLDHDGQLEIFQGGFTDAWTSTAGTVFGDEIGQPAGRSLILRRSPTGRFEPDSDYFDGGTLPVPSMGVSYGDLDLDGCSDFYIGTGNPEGWLVLPNLMFRGVRDGSGCSDHATNISMTNGFGTIQKGHGIVFFDVDGDGDQDLYSSLGGMWPGDRWPNQFFLNESRTGNRWLKIRLRGRQTNRYGVGARIKVRAVNADGHEILRTYLMDHKTGFGSAPYLAHIGLLDATSIQDVEVFWPGSERRCSYSANLKSLNWLDEEPCLAWLPGGEPIPEGRW